MYACVCLYLCVLVYRGTCRVDSGINVYLDKKISRDCICPPNHVKILLNNMLILFLLFPFTIYVVHYLVAKSSRVLGNLMDCSMPGFPVYNLYQVIICMEIPTMLDNMQVLMEFVNLLNLYSLGVYKTS